MTKNKNVIDSTEFKLAESSVRKNGMGPALRKILTVKQSAVFG